MIIVIKYLPWIYTDLDKSRGIFSDYKSVELCNSVKDFIHCIFAYQLYCPVIHHLEYLACPCPVIAIYFNLSQRHKLLKTFLFQQSFPNIII